MNAKKNKKVEIKEIEAPPSSAPPLFSNMTLVSRSGDILLIDFGFLGPDYFEGSTSLKDTQIARICLAWYAAENLSKSINESLKERSAERTRKKSKTKKD